MAMIFASNNKGKLREIKDIFYEYDVCSLSDRNIDIDVCEDENTFYGNALKKSKTVFDFIGEAVIADDSGLCINALGDFPGVFTHRFLGDSATDEERNREIIARLDNVCDRSAKVVCSLVYYDGDVILSSEGILNGKIVDEPRGDNGFGFDSIFELENGKTLAELTSEEKNVLSARYLAAINLSNKLNKYVDDNYSRRLSKKILL